MAENEQNNSEEYQFTEFDTLENDPFEEPDVTSDFTPPPPSSAAEGVRDQTNMKRKVFILLGTLAFLMLLYKFIGGMLSRKSTPLQEKMHQSIPTAVVPEQAQKTVILQEPAATVQPPVVQENNSVIPQKIASIEVSQQQVQSEVNLMTQQVGTVNTNINTLNAQITKMNQMLDDLATQVTKQTEEINVLKERVKVKLIKRRHLAHKYAHHQPVYYINAVIPGRAWLIGSNGSTLTVKEGTKIKGYGVVRLIDSLQGRVLTSSGRVIKFEQENS